MSGGFGYPFWQPLSPWAAMTPQRRVQPEPIQPQRPLTPMAPLMQLPPASIGPTRSVFPMQPEQIRAAPPPTGAAQYQPLPQSQIRPPGFLGLDPATWFQIAGSMFNSEGDPGVALSGVGNALDAQGERRQLQEDRGAQREERGWRREEYERAKQERETLRARAATLRDNAARDPNMDPMLRSLIGAASDDQLMQVLAPQVETAESRSREALTNRELEFRQREGERDRANALRVAGIAAANRRDPTDTIRYRVDLNRLATSADAAAVAPQTLARIGRAREIVTRLAQLNAQGSPLDMNMRINVMRLAGNNSEARALLEEFGRIQQQMALRDAQALKPLTNTDIERVAAITPNANMSPQAALNILDTLSSELSSDVERYTAQAHWLDSNNGLTGTVDDRGRTFEQAWAEDHGGAGGTAGTRAPSGGVRNVDALTDAAAEPEGSVARDNVSGRTMVVRNGRWVPQAAPPAPRIPRRFEPRPGQ